MTGLAKSFLSLAVIAALAGMVWGIQMSATHDHSLAPAHGHLNLLGWVSCSIFAFYYHLFPAQAEGGLAKLHFGTTLAAIVLLAPGIALAIREQTEVVAQAGSVIMVVSMLVFAWIVLRPVRATQGRAAPASG
ncbi:MAG: hypothetical protein GJ676_06335 [Rhodobacteraceae bacterium]|nr:hypothetical protein [Paracoccaceae bacterium]